MAIEIKQRKIGIIVGAGLIGGAITDYFKTHGGEGVAQDITHYLKKIKPDFIIKLRYSVP